jgi:anti-sigma factor RsiW
MNCKEVKPELVAHLDGELQDSIRSEVEAHLESCAACRAEREALASTLKSVESLPAEGRGRCGWGRASPPACWR